MTFDRLGVAIADQMFRYARLETTLRELAGGGSEDIKVLVDPQA